jgi:hypothetical protein
MGKLGIAAIIVDEKPNEGEMYFLKFILKATRDL